MLVNANANANENQNTNKLESIFKSIFTPNPELYEIKYLIESSGKNINQNISNSYSDPLLVTLWNPLIKLLCFFPDSFNNIILTNYKAAIAVQIAALLAVASLGSAPLASGLSWLGMIDKSTITSIHAAQAVSCVLNILNIFFGAVMWIKTIYLSCKYVKELNNNNKINISQKIIAGLSIALAATLGGVSCLFKLPLCKSNNSVFYKPLQGLAWFLLGIIAATSMIISTLLRGFVALSLVGAMVISNIIKPVISLFVAIGSLLIAKISCINNSEDISVCEKIKSINNIVDAYNLPSRLLSCFAYSLQYASDNINNARKNGLVAAHKFLYKKNGERNVLLSGLGDSVGAGVATGGAIQSVVSAQLF